MEKVQVGSKTLNSFTNLYSKLVFEFLKLYEQITDKNLSIRRVGIAFERVQEKNYSQMNLFENIEKNNKEKKLENSIIKIKAKNRKKLNFKRN